MIDEKNLNLMYNYIHFILTFVKHNGGKINIDNIKIEIINNGEIFRIDHPVDIMCYVLYVVLKHDSSYKTLISENENFELINLNHYDKVSNNYNEYFSTSDLMTTDEEIQFKNMLTLSDDLITNIEYTKYLERSFFESFPHIIISKLVSIEELVDILELIVSDLQKGRYVC